MVLYDRHKENREAIGQQLALQHNLTLIPPYNDADIIAGQGTIGLEAANQLLALGLTPDQAIGPIGGGGLITGSATALKQHFPNITLWGAEPESYDDAAHSIAAGLRLANKNPPSSICDAILTPMVGELTFPIMQHYLAGAKVVQEKHVLAAMLVCMQQLKVVVEPGGCVGLAAILNRSLAVKDRITLVILSGGNTDPAMLSLALNQ